MLLLDRASINPVISKPKKRWLSEPFILNEKRKGIAPDEVAQQMDLVLPIHIRASNEPEGPRLTA